MGIPPNNRSFTSAEMLLELLRHVLHRPSIHAKAGRLDMECSSSWNNKQLIHCSINAFCCSTDPYNTLSIAQFKVFLEQGIFRQRLLVSPSINAAAQPPVGAQLIDSVCMLFVKLESKNNESTLHYYSASESVKYTKALSTRAKSTYCFSTVATRVPSFLKRKIKNRRWSTLMASIATHKRIDANSTIQMSSIYSQKLKSALSVQSSHSFLKKEKQNWKRAFFGVILVCRNCTKSYSTKKVSKINHFRVKVSINPVEQLRYKCHPNRVAYVCRESHARVYVTEPSDAWAGDPMVEQVGAKSISPPHFRMFGGWWFQFCDVTCHITLNLNGRPTAVQ